MIVADTSILYALADSRDRGHARARDWYRSTEDVLATTPLVIAEVDYLIRSRGQQPGLSRFRRDLAAGAPQVECWREMLAASVSVAEAYADLGVSLTDGSLVALAERLETTLVATFDERRFRAMKPLTRAPAFQLLPADA